MPRKGLISFESDPVRLGGKRVRETPREHWKAVQKFLEKCTTAKKPTAVGLELYRDDGLDPAVVRKLRASAIQTLKLEEDDPDFDEWDLKPAALEALEWMESVSPIPLSDHKVPAVTIRADYEFKFKGPDGKTLPHQSPKSSSPN